MGDDSTRALIIASMLLASRNNDNDGTFNGDPEYIKRFAYLHQSPNFKPLIQYGFIEMVQDASAVLDGCNTEERRDREEKRRDKEKTMSDKSDEQKIPKWTPEDKSCADEMLAMIRRIAPSAKANDKWPDTIRLIRERDNKTHKEIMEMFAWANADPFWSANILCPGTLREKWVKLEAKRKNNQGGFNGGQERVKILC